MINLLLTIFPIHGDIGRNVFSAMPNGIGRCLKLFNDVLHTVMIIDPRLM